MPRPDGGASPIEDFVTLQQGLASEGGGAGASRLERELRSPRIPLGCVAALVLLTVVCSTSDGMSPVRTDHAREQQQHDCETSAECGARGHCDGQTGRCSCSAWIGDTWIGDTL